ncbi:MAG: DNA polymerase III subunit beta [bacterium]
MKFKCSQKDILKSIQCVQYIIENKNTLPVLSNILLETQENKIILTSTDLEIGIKTSFIAKVEKKGVTVVPAKKFSEIVNGLPEGEIEIELVGENLINIKSGSIFFNINTISSDDFPKFPLYKDNENYFLIPAQILKNMVTSTIFSISHDETRYVLNGILIEKEKNEINLVATDSHRLAFIKEKVLDEKIKDFKVIVPYKSIKEVGRLLTDVDKDIKVVVEEKQVVFLINDIILISRIIDGQFPNYKKVIPIKTEHTFLIERDKILQATKRISILASLKTMAVVYKLTQGALNINIKNPEEGEAQEILKIDYNGPDMEFGYNYRYLLDIYKNLNTKEIIFEWTQPFQPGLIRPKSAKNPIYIVMPIRI